MNKQDLSFIENLKKEDKEYIEQKDLIHQNTRANVKRRLAKFFRGEQIKMFSGIPETNQEI